MENPTRFEVTHQDQADDLRDLSLVDHERDGSPRCSGGILSPPVYHPPASARAHACLRVQLAHSPMRQNVSSPVLTSDPPRKPLRPGFMPLEPI